MHRSILTLAAIAAAASFAAPGDAAAAACRSAAGKFVACPATPQRCRAPSGAFVKCGTPGAKPITAATPVKATMKAKPH